MPWKPNALWVGVWLLCAMFSVQLRANDPGDCNRIGKITINGLDVFKDGGDSKWYYRVFQRLHWETQDRIIRRELLFKEGDCYDPELVAETERNLRASRIFNDAYITSVIDQAAGVVNLTVTTLDRFSLRASLSFSHKGGIDKTQVRFGETNLFGLNKSLKYTYENRSDGNEVRRYSYQDPRIFGNHAMNATYSSTDEGRYREIELGRPFRQLNDRNAYNFSYKRDQTKSDYYQDGGIDTKISNDLTHLLLDWSREYGSRSKSEQLSLQLGYRQDSYGVTPGIVIPDPMLAYPLLITWQQQKRQAFVVCRQVDSLIKTEDIALFTGFFLSSGAEYREENQWHSLFGAGWNQIAKPTENTLSASKISGRIRLSDGDEKASELNGFQHFYVFRGAQTLVAGAAYDYRFTDDDLYLPLTLGEDEGLRGYDAFSFTGNKRFLLNLEHRLTYPWHSHRLALGHVLFIDGGNVWKPGEQSAKLHWSGGMGLRIDAPSLLGHNILRLDLAWPFDGGSPSISFSVGQIFNHNDVNRGFDRDF